MRWILLLTLASLTVVLPAAEPAPQADEVGIVPGDIVLGNIANFPGHAGIYVGRWKDLPSSIRDRFEGVKEQVLLRSRDIGLAESFLVVDSDGGRGVRLASFVEQFTDYLPKGATRPKLAGARVWESQTGAALAWPSLSLDDTRRWRIVEEALAAAAARVPYDDRHQQTATTGPDTSPQTISYWSGKVSAAKRGPTPYREMKDGLDCIAFVHVAYWRGAQIDLDVSWMPFHTPGQLWEEAGKRSMRRAVLFEPVLRDAAILGVWDMHIRTLETAGDHPWNGDMVAWLAPRNGSFSNQRYDEEKKQILGKPSSDDRLSLVPAEDGSFTGSVSDSSSSASITFKKDFTMEMEQTGVDDDGRYRVRVTAEKRVGR